MRRPRKSAGLGFTLMKLGVESQTVVGLRLMMFARGGRAAEREAQNMVREKIDAAMLANTYLAADLLNGTSVGPRKTLAHYRRKVRANRRRLGK